MTQLPNRSVRTAFQLLELLAGSPDGLPLTRLATIAELPKTTVHRILGTLEDLGIVCHDERYHLSAEWQRLVAAGPAVPGPRRARFSAPILGQDGRAVAGLTLQVAGPLQSTDAAEHLHRLVADLAGAVSRRIAG